MLFTRIYYLVLIHLLGVFKTIQSATEVLRPRGVSLDRKIFYDPNKDFQCLDGSESLPFMLVNDDYCDCDDGSDEPGTNACPNGRFHCSNIGFIDKIIPSSRVNDGICDCCDASDEYNSSANCVNNCMEMGEELRQQREQHLILLKEGNQIREQYIEESKQKKEKSKQELEELKRQKLVIEEQKIAKEAIKKDAEEREKVALDTYKEEEEIIKREKEEHEMKIQEEEDSKMAEIAFKEMDLNKDGLLSYIEVQQFSKFDKDGDGVVSEDEAKFFIHAATELGLEEFIEVGWVIMKPFYLKDKTLHDFQTEQQNDETIETQTTDPIETESSPQSNSEVETEDTIEETNTSPTDDDEEEDEGPPPFFPPKDETETTTTTQESRPEYDDETKQLIEKAKEARDQYSEIEGKFLDIQNKIREIEVNLETDYGPDSEFMPLQGQCFEYTDLEYTYKLCPFDSASQRSKNGGSETSLGRWGQWTGPENDRYRQMKFDGGAQCWNGPVRSVTINLSCGTTNEVTGASEPSRCEYAFGFKTPAVCRTDSRTEDSEHIHSEL